MQSAVEYHISRDFARQMDKEDPLKAFRHRFHFPDPGKDQVIYFCGNSLGLQPDNAQEYVDREMEDWRKLAVAGHLHARNPWVDYEKFFRELLTEVTGSKTCEVAPMNSLTVNLHLMMVSFYRPDANRYKILIDGSTFPSDRYAVCSQAAFHGYDPEEAVIEVEPPGETNPVTTRAILDAIEENKDDLALVLISGVHYYTGECFDMEAISKKAMQNNIRVGFDLAHAIGNVPLKLHDWGADFAVWCTYKYLNSGPGSVGGFFVHEKHHNKGLPMFAGWWGHNPESRFEMPHKFEPQKDVLAWQLSNVPVLSMAPHKAALEIFAEAGMDKIRKKSLLLTGYLMHILDEKIREFSLPFSLITPREPEAHGAQVSLATDERGHKLFEALQKKHVVADWRHPAVIRMAPAPLYNSFEDVYRFGQAFEEAVKDVYKP